MTSTDSALPEPDWCFSGQELLDMTEQATRTQAGKDRSANQCERRQKKGVYEVNPSLYLCVHSVFKYYRSNANTDFFSSRG